MKPQPSRPRPTDRFAPHWAELIFLAAIVAVATFLRFYRIGEKTVWLDEAFSVWVARHSLWDAWRWLIRIDQHPPLYYNLLHFWIRLFGDLQGPVRALSALASALTVPIFYAAARRLLGRPTALIAVVILAVSPFHVRFAQEARMYALLTLEVAVLLFFLARLLTTSASAPRRDWLGLAVAQALVMLTHNTAAVYLPLALNAGVGLLLLLGRRNPAVALPPGFGRRWLGVQALALLLWLPWAVPFVIQTVGVDREFWLWPPWPGLVLDTFRNFHFAFLPGDLPLRTAAIWAYPFLAGTGLWGLRRSPGRAGLLLCLFLLPHAIALLVSLRRPLYYDRTLIWTTLPYLLLVAAGMRALASVVGRLGRGLAAEKGLRRGAVAVLLAGVLLLSGLSLRGYFFWFQKEGWDAAASHVAAQVQPGDLIIFNATWVQIPFEYYYRHFGLETELRGLPVDLFERGVLEPKMTEADVPYLHQLIDGRDRVWLVYSHDWYTDPSQIIPRELGQSLREVKRTQFEGLQVVEYASR